MNRTRWIAVLLSMVYGLAIGSAAWSAESASGDEMQRVLFARLLLDSNPQKSRLGALSIAQLPSSETKQSLVDLAAEQLIKFSEIDPGLTTGIADTVGWHVNALATDIGRYRTVLSDVRQRFAHPRLLKRIDAALQSPDMGPVEKYQIRKVDFASLKTELDEKWAANRRRDRSAFTRVQPGTGVGAVLGALGSADEVSTTTMRVASKGRTQMLTLHYAQAGMVLFKVYPTADAREWQVFEAVDELFDVSAVHFGKYFGMAQAIGSLRGSRFRDHLIYSARVILANDEFLPVLEQRVLSADAADKWEKDGIARILELIVRYRSDEAMHALRRIAEESTNEGIQRDALHFATALERRSAADPQPKEPKEESDDEAENDEEA